MNIHPTLGNPNGVRVALWDSRKGYIDVRGLGGASSCPRYLEAWSFHKALREIKTLIEQGTVGSGLLRDSNGTFWNERFEVIGQRREETCCDCGGALNATQTDKRSGLCRPCRARHYA